MPRLRVLAGPSLTELKPISVNTDRAHVIKSDVFEGRVAVYIKGMLDESGESFESEYFEREDKRGITWSIQVQGRFLREYNADDILFGNTFDRPLKLPWGSGAALKFMKFLDPNLEYDLSGPKPWVLSPYAATMPNFVYTPIEPRIEPPEFPPRNSLRDDITYLGRKVKDKKQLAALSLNDGVIDSKYDSARQAKQRRAFFSNAENRRDVIFGPTDILTTDFCYGFITFPQLFLCLPAGISFDLKKYWDGQPVRFLCLERPRPRPESGSRSKSVGARTGSSRLGSPALNDESIAQARVFWCVQIERVEDEEEVREKMDEAEEEDEDEDRGSGSSAFDSRMGSGSTIGTGSSSDSVLL